MLYLEFPKNPNWRVRGLYPYPRLNRFSVWVARRLMRFVGAQVEGQRNIPAQGPYVVASNHISAWDPFFIGIIGSPTLIYVAKKELFDNPALGFLMHVFGTVCVDRGSSSTASLRECTNVLERGGVLGIFPEGHRNRTPKEGLLPFETGVAFFALRENVPVLPIYICYQGPRPLWPHIKIGKPIDVPTDLLGRAGKNRIAVTAKYGVPDRHTAFTAKIRKAIENLRDSA